MHLFTELIGLLGVLLFVTSYFLLNARKLAPGDVMYPLMNLFGSLCIMMSFAYQWNFPAFLMEVIWALISVYGIFLCLKHSAKKAIL